MISKNLDKNHTFQHCVIYFPCLPGSDAWLCHGKYMSVSEKLLTQQRPPFHHLPLLWPANSPDLNSVDYQIWNKMQKRAFTAAVFTTSTWMSVWSKNITTTRRTFWSSHLTYTEHCHDTNFVTIIINFNDTWPWPICFKVVCHYAAKMSRIMISTQDKRYR